MDNQLYCEILMFSFIKNYHLKLKMIINLIKFILKLIQLHSIIRHSIVFFIACMFNIFIILITIIVIMFIMVNLLIQ